MPGLTFDDGPAPDPDAHLVVWFEEWIEAIARHSRKTVAGYVSDAAGFAVELCGVVDKAVPELVTDRDALRVAGETDEVQRLVKRFGFSAGSYVRARALFGVLQLRDLHPRFLGRAVNRYAGTHADASTRRCATSWSSFCRYLVGQQVLASNPMDADAVVLPARPQHLPSPITHAETERVFQICGEEDPRARAPWPARDLAAAALFVSTGVRLEEAITATVSSLFDEVDVGTRIRVLGKGNTERVVPVHPEAALAIRAYLLDRAERLGRPGPGDPLLVRSSGEAFSPQAMRRLVTRWYERAGVHRSPGACVHALRHTFGTQALDSGASIVEVQQLMGHRSLETTKRYLDVVGGGLDAAVHGHASRAMLRRTQKPESRPDGDRLGDLLRDLD